jgi:CO/xanthine dehydrogenase FAD-binding subunit
MNSFLYVDVNTPEQAVAQLGMERGGAALLKAGGIDVLDRLKEGIDAPARLINLRRIDGKTAGIGEIAEVKAAALPEGVLKLLPTSEPGKPPEPRDCLRMGALATLSQIAAHPQVGRALPAVKQAAHGIATPQIRQVATIGGNLLQRPRCWYFRSHDFTCRKKGGDECFALDGENEFHSIFDNRVCAAVHPSGMATALVALDAVVEILGKGGPRHQRLSALLVAPSQPGGDVKRENRLGDGEVLTQVYIPLPGAWAGRSSRRRRSCLVRWGRCRGGARPPRPLSKSSVAPTPPACARSGRPRPRGRRRLARTATRSRCARGSCRRRCSRFLIPAPREGNSHAESAKPGIAR